MPDAGTTEAPPMPDAGTTEAPPMPGAGAREAPPPRVEASLSLTGSALWEGLIDTRVTLSMRNDQALDCTVVAQDGASLAVVRTRDGMLVSVPKAEVGGVRVAEAPRRVDRSVARGGTTKDGRGATAAGAVMLALGIPLGLSGTVWLGLCPGCLYINLPQLLPGIGLIAGGSVALARGKKKNKAFRKAWGIPTAKLRVMPTFGVAREGGHVGMVMRF